MKKDIQNRADIILLVNSFYEKVKLDAEIAHFFAQVNWETHLPKMYDFWENTLFFTGSYKGNPMKTHQHIHDKTPLTKQHFLQWKALFFDTIDEYFEGDNAAIIKQRALSIATVMELKFYSAP